MQAISGPTNVFNIVPTLVVKRQYTKTMHLFLDHLPLIAKNPDWAANVLRKVLKEEEISSELITLMKRVLRLVPNLYPLTFDTLISLNDNNNLLAHKLLLERQSEFFERCLHQPMEERFSKTVKFPDMHPEDVKATIEFIEQGKEVPKRFFYHLDYSHRFENNRN